MDLILKYVLLAMILALIVWMKAMMKISSGARNVLLDIINSMSLITGALQNVDLVTMMSMTLHAENANLLVLIVQRITILAQLAQLQLDCLLPMKEDVQRTVQMELELLITFATTVPLLVALVSTQLLLALLVMEEEAKHGFSWTNVTKIVPTAQQQTQ